jgi:hypothetical protein
MDRCCRDVPKSAGFLPRLGKQSIPVVWREAALRKVSLLVEPTVLEPDPFAGLNAGGIGEIPNATAV